MLPTGIQPNIINVKNLSPTTAYPVTLLDAYNTLSPIYNTKQYYSYNITISTSTPPNQIFNFSYIDTFAVVQYFTLDGTIPFDTFIYIGLYPPTLLNTPTIPFGYIYVATPVSYTPPSNTPYSYQNNQNIVISMNPALNCTYEEFLEATMTNPFSIDTIYLSSNNASQIAQVDAISMFFKDVNGDEAQKELPIFINPYQSSSEGVIIQNKNVIDGFTGIEIQSLLPATSFELYLYPTKRAEQKLIKNKQFIENNNVIGFKQNSLNEFDNFIRNRKKRLGLD